MTIFHERMIYCAFCGTRFKDTETHNASQRFNQFVLVQKIRGWILWIGLGIMFFAINPAITKLYEEKTITQSQAGLVSLIAIAVWMLFYLKPPLARSFTKRRYPEKPSAE